MGLAITTDSFAESDYRRFKERLHVSLRALRQIFERPGFGEFEPSLGAELELSIVDESGSALPINRRVLAQSLDPQLQLELDRFNLEYNLNPVAARGSPFQALKLEMESALSHLGAIAAEHGGRIVTIGILPTLQEHEVASPAMTDLPRYRALSAGLRRLRQEPFQIRINGTDALALDLDDVTLEGAATSLQIHLLVEPRGFANLYNASQLATPIAVAVSANSPTFLGRRLWDETRIALFKQSVDGRPQADADWRAPARVSFGHGWVREGAYELFAESVALFPPLLPVLGDQDPLECLHSGVLPSLEELRLHQGTVWRWNRAVYDPAAGGHLRIEMRALPSGPTPIDMVANAAFLVGLSQGLAAEMQDFLPAMPFEYAHWNFYRCAQQGLDAGVLWPSRDFSSLEERPVRELARELIPHAARGLEALGVDRSEAESLLGIIGERVDSGTTPANWQRRFLDSQSDSRQATVRLLEAYMRQSEQALPVHEWSDRR